LHSDQIPLFSVGEPKNYPNDFLPKVSRMKRGSKELISQGIVCGNRGVNQNSI